MYALEEPTTSSFADQVLSKQRKLTSGTNVAWLTGTSNRLELLFSHVKHIFPDSRKATLPPKRGDADIFKDKLRILVSTYGAADCLSLVQCLALPIVMFKHFSDFLVIFLVISFFLLHIWP